jgi:hypothetical protein
MGQKNEHGGWSRAAGQTRLQGPEVDALLNLWPSPDSNRDAVASSGF